MFETQLSFLKFIRLNQKSDIQENHLENRIDSKSDRWKKEDMFLRGTRLLVAATEDLFQFLLAYIRFRNRRPDSLRRECCISDEDRTRNPSELIHPSSSKILQSESSRPTGQTSGGGKMFKNSLAQ